MTTQLDAAPALVVPGRHHVVRLPGVLALIAADGADREHVGAVLDHLRESSRTAPDAPGRDIARRLTIWLGQVAGNGAGAPAVGVVSASGEGLAIFLHGAVRVVEVGATGEDPVRLDGRDSAFTVDRLVAWPTGRLVLSDAGADLEVPAPDTLGGFERGVVPGTAVVVGPVPGPEAVGPDAGAMSVGAGATSEGDAATSQSGMSGSAPQGQRGGDAMTPGPATPSAATPEAPALPEDATPSGMFEALLPENRPAVPPPADSPPTPGHSPAGDAPAGSRPAGAGAAPRLSERIAGGPPEPARRPLPTATGLGRGLPPRQTGGAKAAPVAAPAPQAPTDDDGPAASPHPAPQPGSTPRPDPSPEPEPEPEPVHGPRYPTEERVRGFRCSRGHLNDPRVSFCRLCGIRMDHVTGILVEDRRPPLGHLVLDIGATFVLDHNYVLGRRPDADPGVREGRLQPVRLDDSSGALSRVHAEIRLTDWDVELVDRGSANGTYVATSHDQAWRRLQPHQSFVLTPGTHVLLGQRTFTFESSAARL